jgi:hypothetical protein
MLQKTFQSTLQSLAVIFVLSGILFLTAPVSAQAQNIQKSSFGSQIRNKKSKTSLENLKQKITLLKSKQTSRHSKIQSETDDLIRSATSLNLSTKDIRQGLKDLNTKQESYMGSVENLLDYLSVNQYEMRANDPELTKKLKTIKNYRKTYYEFVKYEFKELEKQIKEGIRTAQK